MLYPSWNIATTVILLNILISLFSSAYDDVSTGSSLAGYTVLIMDFVIFQITTDAEAHFLAFFAGQYRSRCDYARY